MRGDLPIATVAACRTGVSGERVAEDVQDDVAVERGVVRAVPIPCRCFSLLSPADVQSRAASTATKSDSEYWTRSPLSDRGTRGSVERGKGSGVARGKGGRVRLRVGSFSLCPRCLCADGRRPSVGGRPRLTDRDRRPGDRALVERSRDHHHSISMPIRANRGRMIRLGRCQTDPYVLFQPRIVWELKML